MPASPSPRSWWFRLQSDPAGAAAERDHPSTHAPDPADLGTGFGLDDSLAEGTTDHGWLCPSEPRTGRAL